MEPFTYENLWEQLQIDPEKTRKISVAGAGGKTGLLFFLAKAFARENKRVAITTTTHMQHPEYLKSQGVTLPGPFAEAGDITECLKKSTKTNIVITGVTEERQGKPIKIAGASKEWMTLLERYFDVVLIEADGSRRMPVKAYKDTEPVLADHADKVILCLGMSALGQRIEEFSYEPERILTILGKMPSDSFDEEDYKKLIIHKEGLKGRLSDVSKQSCAIVFCQADTTKRQEAAGRIAEKLHREYGLTACMADLPIYPKVFKDYAMIFLAAGNSIRYGGNKLLSIQQGKPMYRHVLDAAKDIMARKIIVTQYEEIARYGEEYGFEVIRNENPKRGISSSIQLGIEQAGEADGYLFTVCDQPYLTRQTLKEMLVLADISTKGIVAGAVRNETGFRNPIIFDKRYKEELMSIQGDRGGKQVVLNHLEDTAYYYMEKKEAEDIDVRR